MLQWNELHPYNAVHVVRVPEPLALDRLKQAIESAFEGLGLGEIVLNHSQRPSSFTQYAIRNTAQEISALPDASPSTLHSEIQRQLNFPFLVGPRVNPFRFFAQADGASFSLGITYFHPIADAESIVWLLKICIQKYFGGNSRDSVPSLELYPDIGPPLLFRHPLLVLRKIAAIPASAAAMRRCFRPPIRNYADFQNGFAFFSLPNELLQALVAASKSWNVTLNDVFLAILLKCVSPLASRRALSAKRKQIGVGCIVNLRKELGFDARPVFGLFLGSFVIAHEVPEGLSLENLSRDVRRQTARIKERRLALATPVELAFGRLLFSFFSTKRQKKLYQKNYPLWGGITNMNLNSIWEQPEGAAPIDYFRAVSTGPATPLVLSTTTAADHLNVGLTFRSTVFSQGDIQQIKAVFLACANQVHVANRTTLSSAHAD